MFLEKMENWISDKQSTNKIASINKFLYKTSGH